MQSRSYVSGNYLGVKTPSRHFRNVCLDLISYSKCICKEDTWNWKGYNLHNHYQFTHFRSSFYISFFDSSTGCILILSFHHCRANSSSSVTSLILEHFTFTFLIQNLITTWQINTIEFCTSQRGKHKPSAGSSSALFSEFASQHGYRRHSLY